MFAACEAEKKTVVADVAVRFQAGFESGEIDGAMALVNLNGVAAAEGNVRAAFSAKMAEVAREADFAAGARRSGGDFRPLIGPEVAGEQGTAHSVPRTGEILERFSDGNGGGEVNGCIEDARGVTGFNGAAGRFRKDAGEASSFAGDDIHGDGVGGNGGGVDPWTALLDGIVVEEIAGLEVVGGVQDDVSAVEQLVDVAGGEIGDVSANFDCAVEESDFAAGGLGFRQGFASVGLVEEDLALEVAFFDEVTVDESEGADAGAGEESSSGRSGSSAADERDVRRGEPFLAGFSDAGKEYLTRVSLPGLVLDWHGRGRHESLV